MKHSSSEARVATDARNDISALLLLLVAFARQVRRGGFMLDVGLGVDIADGKPSLVIQIGDANLGLDLSEASHLAYILEQSVLLFRNGDWVEDAVQKFAEGLRTAIDKAKSNSPPGILH